MDFKYLPGEIVDRFVGLIDEDKLAAFIGRLRE